MAKVKAQELLLMPGEQELGRFSSGSGIEEGCQRSTAYTVIMTNARLIVHQRAYLFWCIPYDTEYSLMTKEVVDVIITNSSGGWIVGIISTCIGAVVLAAGGAANSVVWIVIGVFFLVVAFFAMLLFILKIVKRDMDVFIDVCKDKSVIASHANAFTRGQPRGKCCKVVLPAAEGYRLMHAILAHPETQLLEAPTHVQVNCAV